MFLNDDVLLDYKFDVFYMLLWVIFYYIMFKISWDWVIFFLMFYIMIFVLFFVCFVFEYDVVFVLDLFVDWMFLVDIVLNFYMIYVGKDGEVIDDFKMICWNYICSWFFLDLVLFLLYGIFFYVMNSSVVSFYFE